MKRPKCKKCGKSMLYDAINDVWVCEGQQCDEINDLRIALKEMYLVSKSKLR